MIFRCYWRLEGGHVRCRIFSGPRGGTLGQCGVLMIRAGTEWQEFYGNSSKWMDMVAE